MITAGKNMSQYPPTEEVLIQVDEQILTNPQQQGTSQRQQQEQLQHQSTTSSVNNNIIDGFDDDDDHIDYEQERRAIYQNMHTKLKHVMNHMSQANDRMIRHKLSLQQNRKPQKQQQEPLSNHDRLENDISFQSFRQSYESLENLWNESYRMSQELLCREQQQQPNESSHQGHYRAYNEDDDMTITTDEDYDENVELKMKKNKNSHKDYDLMLSLLSSVCNDDFLPTSD